MRTYRGYGPLIAAMILVCSVSIITVTTAEENATITVNKINDGRMDSTNSLRNYLTVITELSENITPQPIPLRPEPHVLPWPQIAILKTRSKAILPPALFGLSMRHQRILQPRRRVVRLVCGRP